MSSTIELPRIGLLNLMPAPVLSKTEAQWRDGFADDVVVVPIRFDEDPRANGCRSAQFLDDHIAISDAASGLDGLIVTGANLEVFDDAVPLPFDDITYIDQLREVIDWSQGETRLSVYSCLASHIALDHLFGVSRDILDQKTFGVYCHDVMERSWLTEGFGESVVSPHSRWGSVPAKLLQDAGIAVMAESFEAGWLLAGDSTDRHKTVFVQGHPEYGQYDLADEYARDAESGQAVPYRYFPHNDPSRIPAHAWTDDATQLFANLASAVQPSLV